MRTAQYGREPSAASLTTSPLPGVWLSLSVMVDFQVFPASCSAFQGLRMLTPDDRSKRWGRGQNTRVVAPKGRPRNRGLYGWRGRCFLNARRKSGGFAPLSFLVQCSYEIPEESVPSNSRAPALCPLPTLSATNFSFRPPAGEKGVAALAAVTHTLVSNPHRLRAGLVQPALITSRTTRARGIAVTTVTHTLVSHQTRPRRI